MKKYIEDKKKMITFVESNHSVLMNANAISNLKDQPNDIFVIIPNMIGFF